MILSRANMEDVLQRLMATKKQTKKTTFVKDDEVETVGLYAGAALSKPDASFTLFVLRVNHPLHVMMRIKEVTRQSMNT